MSGASAGRLALWPSIDLRGGRVVRLLRGEWDTATTFDTDPLEVAKTFEREGADGLHVVDLDAAFGKGTNSEEIQKILRVIRIPVQVGGGMRSGQAVEDFLERVSGARAVVGSLPFLDRPAFIHLLRKSSSSSPFPLVSRIVVALDCKDGRPTVRGWTEDAGAGDAVSVARELAGLGVAALLVTDVARDGAMLGPNLSLLAAVRAVFPGEILASGGMRGPEDLGPVDAAISGGLRGAIFGRALHAGATTVAALKSARDEVTA
ncbi:MAG: 1-(5-phosphoribosyl)-5-[(5-phosphoribosylamino)methylideneamino] imidazole-4-carboxamide isomerase [Acidobacteria bacterium]|nr:1-(5-phosphoribosyl)-5-[(5-phosphoribosylamino)methylideneamino] imidazole-4-carboxamide isomerase [Acidobacteriota bacterium]